MAQTKFAEIYLITHTHKHTNTQKVGLLIRTKQDFPHALLLIKVLRLENPLVWCCTNKNTGGFKHPSNAGSKTNAHRKVRLCAPPAFGPVGPCMCRFFFAQVLLWFWLELPRKGSAEPKLIGFRYRPGGLLGLLRDEQSC